MVAVPVQQAVSGPLLPVPVMGGRLGWLEASWPVFKQTGLPLVGEANGVLFPIPVGDDIGLYVLAPTVARIFGLSLHGALSVVLVASAAIGASLAILQLWVLFKDWPTRLYAAVAVGLTALVILFAAGDVYMIGAMASLVLLPLCAIIALRAPPMSLHWLPLVLLVGAFAQGCNLVRSNSATGAIIAIALVVLLHRVTALRIRAVLLVGLVAGIGVMALLGNSVVTARDGYLMAHRSDYKPIPPAHPMWHSIYIGFGFLANPYGIAYKDEVAMDMARKIDAKLANPVAEEWQYDLGAHERALRQATLTLAREHPFFLVRTLAAKCGIIALFVLMFGNVGLLGIRHLFVRPRLGIPIFFALALSAAPGALVQPSLDYLSAFVAGLAVTAAVSIGLARQHSKRSA